MRVAVLANAGLATTKVYTALANLGHEVHLFTFLEPMYDQTRSPELLERLEPVFLPNHLKWVPPALALILRRRLRGIRPDVWHAHIAIPYGLTASLARWRPFLLSTHGSDVYFSAWTSKSPKLRLVLPGMFGALGFRVAHHLLAMMVDGVVVYSPDMMEHLPRLGYAVDQLFPCFLGIDTTQFRPARKKAAEAAGFHIVCTRVLEPLYDHRTLLEAFAQVRANGIPARLSLAGDGSLRPSLEDYASELGVRGSVEFLGFVPHDTLPTLLARSDVLVSPAQSDTTSMSVLEGMASGLPVVVTKVGSLAHRIHAGANGFLFQPGDVTALASHLATLAADESLRRRMGEENRRRAVREFDLRDTVCQLERIYEAVASPRSRRKTRLGDVAC